MRFVCISESGKSCAARQEVLLEMTQGHDRDNICQGREKEPEKSLFRMIGESYRMLTAQTSIS